MAKEIPTPGGSYTVSDHQIYDAGGDYKGTIDNYGHIAGADGKEYFINSYKTVTETGTGRVVGQVLDDGTYMPSGDSSASESGSSSGSSSVSTLGAIAMLMVWLLSIAVNDTIMCLELGFVCVVVTLAGFAFPSFGAMLMRFSVISESFRSLEDTLPKTVSFLRTPENARTVLAVVAGVTLFFLLLDLIGLMRVFRKKGINPLLAFVPIVNVYELCKAAGGGTLMFVLQFVPCIQMFAVIWMYIRLAMAFNRSGFYAVPLIICRPLFLNLLPRGGSKRA